MLIIVTDTGMGRETTLRVSDRLNADSLFAISRMLTDKLRDLSLRQVQEMLYGYAAHGGADARVLSGIAELAGQIEKQPDTDRLTVGGAHNILHYPEYADVIRARAFMDTLERKESLLNLMRPQEGGAVRSGYETGMKELHDCAVVTAPYRMGRGHIGAIGVIGPTRMQYSRVLAAVNMMGRQLSQLFSTTEDDGTLRLE